MDNFSYSVSEIKTEVSGSEFQVFSRKKRVKREAVEEQLADSNGDGVSMMNTL